MLEASVTDLARTLQWRTRAPSSPSSPGRGKLMEEGPSTRQHQRGQRSTQEVQLRTRYIVHMMAKTRGWEGLRPAQLCPTSSSPVVGVAELAVEAGNAGTRMWS